MKNITDVLTKTGKATVREVAAILDVDFRDALALLRDQEQEGRVESINGYWQLTEAGTRPDENAVVPEPEPVAHTVKGGVPKTGVEALLKLLAEHGAMTTEELAKIAGVTARKVASTLAIATNRGKVLRQQQEGKFRYVLPEQNQVAPVPEGFEVSEPAQTASPEPELPPADGDCHEAKAAPLKVIWSAPEDVQTFPTLAWVRERRRELKNEMRWLGQIENIARQINRKKAAVEYLRERV